MWEGTVEKFADVHVEPLINWLLPIPFELWPQQNPANQELKPAMTNESWRGLKEVSDYLVDELKHLLGGPVIKDRMLSVVMPGHDIYSHTDTFGPEWFCRVHVPLTTNSGAVFFVDSDPYRMEVGSAYKVNISKIHSVINSGETPRIHFMFDCYAA